MTGRFAGKVALVTGGGRGIGRAIALRLAREGADVAVNFFRHRESADETAAEIRALGRRAAVFKANMGEEADIDRLFAEVGATFGGIDLLVNNAASGYARPIMEQRVKGWDWTMNINARAALFAGQRAAPIMQGRGGGAIVNISSIGAMKVMPEYVLIGASKAALETITRYMAVEFAPMGINVNAVSAGFVATDALKVFSVAAPILQDPEAFAKARIPAGRMVTPEDVAAAVAFLCTPDAAMVRGQTLIVDGGFTLID